MNTYGSFVFPDALTKLEEAVNYFNAGSSCWCFNALVGSCDITRPTASCGPDYVHGVHRCDRCLLCSNYPVLFASDSVRRGENPARRAIRAAKEQAFARYALEHGYKINRRGFQFSPNMASFEAIKVED